MEKSEIISLLPAFIRNSETYYLIVTDLEGKYSYVNETFKNRFGFLHLDFLGQPSSVAIHPEDYSKCTEIVQQCFLEPDKVFTLEIRKPSNLQNDYHWTQWEFSLFKDLIGNPIGILCFGHDITISKQSEIKIGKQNERLKEITWQQSHEVRRHMVNIMGLYNLIKHESVLTPEEKLEQIDLLLNETKALDEKIHSIVEWSIGKE
jgi:PAS domain S-box-containing protein